uniref:Reverse transcriptase domain-containing protein n=1 Tax=Caenorhabditis japonica TaxID=281687 RepID=A0A8R1E6N9_CAEJA
MHNNHHTIPQENQNSDHKRSSPGTLHLALGDSLQKPEEMSPHARCSEGDPISPNLFSACLESVFNKLSWQHLRGDEDDENDENDKAKLLPGIRINGQNLTHLRFVDDIVLVASNPKAASLMAQELAEMGGKVGLRMNTNKTKVMRNTFASQSPVNVTLNNVTTCIEEVNEYVYLGRLLNHNNELEPELHRRRRAAWAAFNNIKNTTYALSCPRIRAQLFDSIVLPALTYGSEVWIFTQAPVERVRVTHVALERRSVGISLSEQRQGNLHREDIRAQSEVRGPLLVIKKKKLGWAGHIMRRNDGRWTDETDDDGATPYRRKYHYFMAKISKNTGQQSPRTEWRQINETSEYVDSEKDDLKIDTETENEVFAIWREDPEGPNEAYNKKKGQIENNKEDDELTIGSKLPERTQSTSDFEFLEHEEEEEDVNNVSMLSATFDS